MSLMTFTRLIVAFALRVAGTSAPRKTLLLILLLVALILALVSIVKML